MLKTLGYVVYDGCLFCGWLAQLVEHLVYTEGVKGSSPLLTLLFSHSPVSFDTLVTH